VQGGSERWENYADSKVGDRSWQGTSGRRLAFNRVKLAWRAKPVGLELGRTVDCIGRKESCTCFEWAAGKTNTTGKPSAMPRGCRAVTACGRTHRRLSPRRYPPCGCTVVAYRLAVTRLVAAPIVAYRLAVTACGRTRRRLSPRRRRLWPHPRRRTIATRRRRVSLRLTRKTPACQDKMFAVCSF